MFVGRFVAAKCYSLLFVLVRGSSFWSGIVADIPFCVSYLSLTHSLTQTLALFLVLQYLVYHVHDVHHYIVAGIVVLSQVPPCSSWWGTMSLYLWNNFGINRWICRRVLFNVRGAVCGCEVLLTLVCIGERFLVLVRYCCGYSFLCLLFVTYTFTYSNTGTILGFTVLSVLFILGAVIVTNVELWGIVHEVTT